MQLICIGRIVNTRGLKGDLKVVSATDFKTQRYHPDNKIYVQMDEGYEVLAIAGFQVQKGCDIIRFQGLDDINLVEKYKGRNVYVEDVAITDLPANEFHVQEIIGLMVIQGGKPAGVVEAIRELPQGDYLLIRNTDQQTALVPFIDELVTEVDLKGKTLTVVEMEGLL